MKTLNQLSGMPQIKSAFKGWTISLTAIRFTQEVIDGFVQDTKTNLPFTATVQPLSPKEISLKPEGQREWEWLQIHATAKQPKLKLNDRIVYNEKVFKVMPSKDYSLNGYIEYHAIEDFQNE